MTAALRLRKSYGIAICALTFALSANAAQILTNGGFESGDFTGWTVTNSNTTGSFFVTNSPVSPLTGNPTVGPNSGTYYAVSDSFIPGTYALTQTFTDPVGSNYAILSFAVFVNDQFGGSGAGGRVDLLAAGANPLTGTPLATFFSADTAVMGGNPNPYIVTSVNITSLLTVGTSYQLRVLESDATGPINVGVDSFSLNASSVPEPAMLAPLTLLCGAVIASARRRKSVESAVKL